MKKIAILTSSQHAIPHGGIGQFTKKISDLLMNNGHEVTILLDKKPRHNFLFTTAHHHMYTMKPLPSVQGSDRHTQEIDYAKVENFKEIIQKTLDMNYDLYIVNTSEAMDAITQVKPNGKVILYTHLFNQIFPEQAGKSVFSPDYVRHFNSFLYGDYTVATQSEFNKTKLLSNGVKDCIVMPMPMTETSLLESSKHLEKSGVLYIGTHSPGKNPSDYIKVMKKLQLPCKVMTSPKSAKTFESKFKKEGIKDYDIRVQITGEEKVNFIKSCKVSFNCSLLENYPFAFLETVGHMPVVVLDKQIWSDNFDNQYYHKVNIRKAHEVIKDLYHKPYNDNALEYVKNLNEKAIESWLKL